MANWWQRLWPRLTAYVLAVVVATSGASFANSLLLWGELGNPEAGVGGLLLAAMREFFMTLPILGPLVAAFLLATILLAGWLKPAARPLAPFAYPLAGWVALLLSVAVARALYGPDVLAAADSVLNLLVISLAGVVGGMLFALLRKRRII